MKALDRYLQKARILKAAKFIEKDTDILDVGCSTGFMFEHMRGHIKNGIGIDPELTLKVVRDFYTLLPGYFPESWPVNQKFDVITMLAVIEHIPPAIQLKLATVCYELLNDNGKIIITVPSHRVDPILNILFRFRLIDGMSIKEHSGFRPANTQKIFPQSLFKVQHKKRFQFGLNNLFVLEKIN